MELRKAGGDTIRNAGDTYHQRGNLSPEVLNPVMDAHWAMIDMGFKFDILAGNHDLAGKESTRLGSAITSLEGLGCRVVNEPLWIEGNSALMIPWMSNIQELKNCIEQHAADYKCGDVDLIIHAPIDDVIPGLPDHGLTADWLAGLGFKRVFSGHYHNYKDFGNGVYSIGSTSHLTWSDVGSKAGFLIVYEDRVQWFKSHTPEFIDLTEDMDPDDVPLIVSGNYVRAKVTTSKVKEINELREWLEVDCKVAGVFIQTVKEPIRVRTGSVASSVSAGASIEVSIAEYIKGELFSNAEQVQLECQRILAETGAAI
jgi:DNA repair exonuclease SbcCD nuclease subunit